MNTIRDILITKRIAEIKNQSQRPINLKWERAKEFGEYIGVPTVLVLRLFKDFGESKVISLKSWIKDYPVDSRGAFRILKWKLLQDEA